MFSLVLCAGWRIGWGAGAATIFATTAGIDGIGAVAIFSITADMAGTGGAAGIVDAITGAVAFAGVGFSVAAGLVGRVNTAGVAFFIATGAAGARAASAIFFTGCSDSWDAAIAGLGVIIGRLPLRPLDSLISASVVRPNDALHND